MPKKTHFTLALLTMSETLPIAAPRQNNAGTYTNTLTGETTTVENTAYVSSLSLMQAILKGELDDVVLDISAPTSTYGPRGSYVDENGTIQYRDNLTGVPLSVAEIEYLKTGIDIRQSANQFINVTYRPDYFAQAAAAYIGTDKDARKLFLADQIKKLQQSIQQYQLEAISVQKQAAEFDGQSDVAKWMSMAGGIAITTGNPYAVAAGALAVAMGTIIKWAQTKADAKELQPIIYKAQLIQAEAAVIGQYYEKYTRELKGNTMLVIALAAGAFYVIKKGSKKGSK